MYDFDLKRFFLREVFCAAAAVLSLSIASEAQAEVLTRTHQAASFPTLGIAHQAERMVLELGDKALEREVHVQEFDLHSPQAESGFVFDLPGFSDQGGSRVLREVGIELNGAVTSSVTLINGTTSGMALSGWCPSTAAVSFGLPNMRVREFLSTRPSVYVPAQSERIVVISASVDKQDRFSALSGEEFAANRVPGRVLFDRSCRVTRDSPGLELEPGDYSFAGSVTVTYFFDQIPEVNRR